MLVKKLLPQSLINFFWHRPLSFIARIMYGFPDKKLCIIGVTGTDGKTTTSSLIYQVLRNANLPVSLMTTVEAKIGQESINTGLHTTTPDKFQTFKLIRQAVNAKSKYLIAEVTAHGIDQYRYGHIRFDIGILLNVSHEHLDDFKNLEKYTQIKINLLKRSKYVIYNKDDQSSKHISNLKNPKVSFSQQQKSDFQATNIKLTPNSLSFSCRGIKFITDSNYLYQTNNILAAYIACKKIGIDDQTFLNTIRTFPQVKGRRQLVDNQIGITTIVDFAHTPQALESTLQSLNKLPHKRIIVIFGATGGRDKTKRPLMGKVVSNNANIAIITSDDTRNEKIENINSDIIKGIKSDSQYLKPNQAKNINSKIFNYFCINNRQDAFNLAIKISQKNDIVIACGKGHETTILLGKTEYPWSETEAFRTAFKLKDKYGKI